MENKKIVIIGNTAVGFSAAKALRNADPDIEITVICKEQYPAYCEHRLVEFFSGQIKEDELFLCNDDFYQDNKINLLKSSQVARLNENKKQVILKDNQKLGYDYLVIAPRQTIKPPDIKGKAKQGVFTFDSLDNVKQVIQRIDLAHTVCLAGSSDACLRVAQAIASRDKDVKIICKETDYEDQVFERIEFIRGIDLTEIIGEGEAKAIKLSNDKIVGASLVLFVDGLMPCVDFLKNSNIECTPDYICVDYAMRTNVADIFAVGVVCNDQHHCKTPQAEGEAVAESLINTLKGVNMEEPSNVVIDLAQKGASTIFSLTKAELEKATNTYGKDKEIAFGNTAYFLPLINALLNLEIRNLSDCVTALSQAESLLNNQAASNGLKLDALSGVLNIGLATLICEEMLAALLYLDKQHPQADYVGFIPDTLLRSLGIQLVDGRIAGIAVVLGYPKDADAAVDMIRELQSKNIVSILVGSIEDKSMKDILEAKGVKLGLENYIIPLGKDYLSVIYAINWAIRAALTFGGCKSGQWENILEYTKTRVPAFVMLLDYADEIIAATGLGALALGFPIITDLDLPQLPKIETTLYEALLVEKDYTKLVARGIEARDIKVKVRNLDLPVPYSAAFEGERIRKEQLRVECGGRSSQAIEYLAMKDSEQITDGKIEVIGPDIDQLSTDDKSLPLGIAVEVYGRKMEVDFEPVLERQIHRYTNYAMGVMHIGQRDVCWIRVSQQAYEKGFRLKDIGVFLHAMFHEEYAAIVDKIQITLYTGQDDVEALAVKARQAYMERDERLSGMTDESVDTFYSCLLCQSFAPNHVCMITPERLGLCGAYSWLDAKACYEITPTGPNQPVLKEAPIDEKLGQWKNINNFVYEASNRSVSTVSMYSLMDNPQTSCGCFECIVAIIPEANGFMIVNRDYSGTTPCGMNFSTLAGSVGGGVQTPGFLGVGKLYIASKKFISADGGLSRIVWMPKELKESLSEKLKQRCEEVGQPDLLNKIADETQAVNSEELMEFLTKVGHPALEMPPLI